MYFSKFVYQPNTHECRTFLVSSYDARIKIEVDKTDIEYSFECQDDYVALYDGNGNKQKLVKKWCGKTENFTLMACGPTFIFVFHSDNDFQTGKGVYMHISAHGQIDPDNPPSTGVTIGVAV
ncbi:unnamed protein product [Dimorphilus gyrociliatus]|uniref:CUB domain-containing protein n=1 Tax=Dimorphilus gyrociliatus TaxID=2664684 RepID=A0A7I8WEP9_9ANNE|nr:unnamed protein product [Dimorphilus gyrociliatus]